MSSLSLLSVYFTGASMILLLTTVSRAKDYNFTPSPDYEYDYDNESLKISFYSNTSSQEFDKFSEKYIDQEEEVTEVTEVTGGWPDEKEVTVTMATTRGATERMDVRNSASLPPAEIRTLVWTLMILICLNL